MRSIYIHSFFAIFFLSSIFLTEHTLHRIQLVLVPTFRARIKFHKLLHIIAFAIVKSKKVQSSYKRIPVTSHFTSTCYRLRNYSLFEKTAPSFFRGECNNIKCCQNQFSRFAYKIETMAPRRIECYALQELYDGKMEKRKFHRSRIRVATMSNNNNTYNTMISNSKLVENTRKER